MEPMVNHFELLFQENDKGIFHSSSLVPSKFVSLIEACGLELRGIPPTF